MEFPLLFALFVLIPGIILGAYTNVGYDVTYDDLLRTNVSCAFSEICTEDGGTPTLDRRCSCFGNCSLSGSCCIDSPHRGDRTPIRECRTNGPTFSRSGHLLISRCPPSVGSDSVWKGLCEGEWDGEDDVMMLAPVSSTDTFATYKNYYCFRCHEDSDEFESWGMRIAANADRNRVSNDLSIAYDGEKRGWTATTADGYVLEPITFTFFEPDGLVVRPQTCTVALVSDCHRDWTEEETREKCRASYSAIVYSRLDDSVSFKNPHCALCNFLQVGDISCGGNGTVDTFEAPKRRFSFADLLNIHPEDLDQSETEERCGENQLWDPYGKKCRRIACAIPGYAVKEGRCTSP